MILTSASVRRRSFANSHQHKLHSTHSFAKIASEVCPGRRSAVASRLEPVCEVSPTSSTNTTTTPTSCATDRRPTPLSSGHRDSEYGSVHTSFSSLVEPPLFAPKTPNGQPQNQERSPKVAAQRIKTVTHRCEFFCPFPLCSGATSICCLIFYVLIC